MPCVVRWRVASPNLTWESKAKPSPNNLATLYTCSRLSYSKMKR